MIKRFIEVDGGRHIEVQAVEGHTRSHLHGVCRRGKEANDMRRYTCAGVRQWVRAGELVAVCCGGRAQWGSGGITTEEIHKFGHVSTCVLQGTSGCVPLGV